MTATRRWKVLKSDTPSPIYNGIVCMISASDKIIAVVTEDDRPFMPDDWAEAARLIAAAPEMAEALANLRAHVSFDARTDSQEKLDAMRAADAALSKAGG